MQEILQATDPIKTKAWDALRRIVTVSTGCALLAGLSQIEIPLIPVPITLQTLGVMLLGLFYSPTNAALSATAYLAAATCGLPVLAGGAVNPLWIVGTNAGYLLSFPFAAYCIAMLKSKIHQPSALKTIAALLVGQAIIYAGGLTVLAFYVGLANVLYLGLFPFIPGGILKVAAAFCFDKAKESFRK